MVAEFVGTVWENGEFGIALAPKVEPLCPFDVNAPSLTPDEQEWNRNLIKVHGAIEVLEFKGVDPLGLSPRPKNHRPTIRGQKGITGHGKKLIRNACYRLERENRKELLTFATFTLPDVTRDESLFIAENWGEIIRVFVQRLTRVLKRAGLPGEVVGATEIQEQRTFRDGVMGLHIHLVFAGRRKGCTWALPPEEYSTIWKEVISGYLFWSPVFYDWTAVHNVQRVQKSVESYLGKYVTKGVKAVARVVEEFGEGCLPRHWYTCTNSLRSRVMEKRVSLTAYQADTLLKICLDYPDVFFVYRSPINVKMPSGKEMTVGWFGRVKPEYIDLFNGKG